jgi:uncharacterized MnhB-related membrane protein
VETVVIANFVQILLIVITLAMVLNKNNMVIAIMFSLSSLFIAILFFFNSAPDVALAEIAVGSAIMPLIIIISISKQREYVVITHIEDDYFVDKEGEGYKILEKFTDTYNLKLNIQNRDLDDISGIFRERNVDLIIDRAKDGRKYHLKGKKSSLLMNRLERMTKGNDLIKVIKQEEDETYD